MMRAIVLSALLGVLAIRAVAETATREYVDRRYHFAFRYPSDWTLDDRMQPGKGGETRVVVRDSRSSARASASIGQLGQVIAKADGAQQETVAQALIDLSLKQIYEPVSRQLQGKKMVVADQQVLSSRSGVQFYVSTLHNINDERVVIAGMHLVPFDQPYMISFIMMSPFEVGKERQRVINDVLKSFRPVAPQE